MHQAPIKTTLDRMISNIGKAFIPTTGQLSKASAWGENLKLRKGSLRI